MSTFGDDFVPSPGQRARADQQFARSRDAVARLVEVAGHQPKPGQQLVVAVGLRAADEVMELSDDDDSALGAALALVASAVLQVATLTAERDRLRDELDEAQQQAAELLSDALDHGGRSDLKAAEAQRHVLAARLAQAERVVETARAWARVWRTLVAIGQPLSPPGRDLLAAVDALDGTAGPFRIVVREDMPDETIAVVTPEAARAVAKGLDPPAGSITAIRVIEKARFTGTLTDGTPAFHVEAWRLDGTAGPGEEGSDG